MTLDEYISKNISVKHSYEDNPYVLLYMDLLDECNMNCKLCYNHNLTPRRLTLEQVEELYEQVPKKVVARYLGGEPTLHDDFFEFIKLARKYGNYSTMSSNGLMYVNDDFVETLSDPMYNNRGCAYSITLNGGFDPKHPAYHVIDNDQSSGAIKLQGLANLLKYNIKNIYLTAIILKGLNEPVIKELVDFAKQHKNIAGVKVRSPGVTFGCDVDTDAYSMVDFRDDLFPKYLGEEYSDKVLCDGESDDRCRKCCYEFKTGHVIVKHVEFDSDGATKCWKRGYVDFDNKLIYPFFEYVKLKEQFYES